MDMKAWRLKKGGTAKICSPLVGRVFLFLELSIGFRMNPEKEVGVVSNIAVTLPDGSQREYPRGTTVLQVARDIGPGLAKAAVAGKVGQDVVDLDTPLEEDCELGILTFDSDEGKSVYRHSVAHIMAQAVKRLYPHAKLGIGPAIKDGFYYDFDINQSLTPDDLETIEEEMKRIISEGVPFERSISERDQALKALETEGEDYKIELVGDLPEGEEVSFYQQGDFVDLCAGPHVVSTDRVKANGVKLLSVAGAYWRGSERNPMLQRIYGTAFEKPADLEAHLNMLEEARRRDHRRLGQQLDLFSLHPEGPGFPFMHPKGMIVWNELIEFWREEHRRRGYDEIKTPIMLHGELWRRSGHWDHYRENMYFTEIDEGDYVIKPMNCPGGILLYGGKTRSYRDFPMRVAEIGLVHRHELSGVLHGLMRVRSFHQDDAHIYMTPDMVTEELVGVLELVDAMYRRFGFDYYAELSTRPEKFLGEVEMWDLAEEALHEALERTATQFSINPGDGAFYGPKIDIHVTDSLGRGWQCATIQLDFQLPERFDLTYVGSDGEEHRPVMIHRTIYGSIERFMGVLIEHYGGAFPTWLAPVQVRIIPIADRHHQYAGSLQKELEAPGLRVEVDDRNEKVGYKIRAAEVERIPYVLVVGDNEVESGKVSLRTREEGDIGTVGFEAFRDAVAQESDTRGDVDARSLLVIQ